MIFIIYLITFVLSLYTPENGDDWTSLKPETLGDGVQTVPFNFGLVVTLVEDNDGNSNVNTFQIDDGQIQKRPEEEGETIENVADHESTPVKAIACINDNTLLMSLRGGILRDSNNRIGTIVSNRQFQFDGPTPQYGAIYANGWSIDNDGNLNLGENSIFYQCSSGEFYNLYDEEIDSECNQVNLKVVGLVDC